MKHDVDTELARRIVLIKRRYGSLHAFYRQLEKEAERQEEQERQEKLKYIFAP